MYIFSSKYHVIVIGAGHAGCEASLAASRMGCNVLLLTGNLDTIAQMSCNPAIGGLAKGHLVREIDALGGEMAHNIDATGIQFRILNKKKGPAVWGYRAQADKKAYQARMKHVLEGQNGLDIKQEMAIEIILESGSARGVICQTGNAYHADCVIVTSGTFLDGVIHIGEMSLGGGRSGEQASVELASNLRKIGLETGRLKTGTPPRINIRDIDSSVMVRQDGDPEPAAFSFSTGKIEIEQMPCFITHTTENTKNIILENLKRSPLYSGKIKATGVRYCPSIEDKMVKFPDKVGHQVFIEPEGRDTKEAYLNGASTSLPCDLQLAVVRSIVGLEKAEILRHGYAIEYDYVLPTQLYGTLETKNICNLYLAGQINGSSGYEEAAAQGLMAGINAALRAKGKEPVVLDRSQAYIGVLIDDLVTKGTMEPYRMFTS
ncbi:MAG: tRNA uridine-5-carboxymethylaminomethyl(34) synthesis enzyme MnmG, partial [Candidatus Micrarchaeota archaeon]|nr:tRNA uridine-5-carboxymethylaminomethyl(34) synthesis enzyme MnmG [Candidatus Micrarchaeota archaeon]